MIVGGDRFGWFGLGLGEQMGSRAQECFHGCGRTGRFQKASTVQVEHSYPHGCKDIRRL
jgi:hypothetical protein